MKMRGRDKKVIRVEGKLRWSETGRGGGARRGQGKRSMVDVGRGDVTSGGERGVDVARRETDKRVREHDVIGGRRWWRWRRRAGRSVLLRMRVGIPFGLHGGVADVCGGCRVAVVVRGGCYKLQFAHAR